MIALLDDFVLAADEVWRLQRESDPECRLFRRLVFQDEAPRRGTTQGTYVFSPDGRLLARRNSNRAATIATLLRSAQSRLAKEESKDPAVRIPKDATRRWEDSWPEDGLVLRRWARDLPPDLDPQVTPATRRNPDALWFSADEARRWLPADLVPGARHELPTALAERLVGLTLVDNARGQTIPFAPAEIQEATIRVEVTAVDGDMVDVRLTGKTRAEAPGPWLLGPSDWEPKSVWPHGIRTSLRGRARWSRQLRRFTVFHLLALGHRTGRTINNGRSRGPEEGPIGFTLELAPSNWRIAPTFIEHYDVPWVRHPASPRLVREGGFSVELEVRFASSTGTMSAPHAAAHPLLLADKAWNTGKLIDVTSHHDLGRTRTSGTARGFAFALRPDGSWSFNLGDGRRRIDYRGAMKETLLDGQTHRLAATVDRRHNEARLFHDGREVAVYSLADLGRVSPENRTLRSGPGVLAARVHPRVMSPQEIQKNQTPADLSVPPKRLRVLAWNIWHGGRRDGNKVGLEKTIAIIREAAPDIICMQETYGSGPAIASALGFHFYLRSSNLSIMSRYPIIETHDLHQPFRFGGVTLDLGGGRRLKVFDLWINSSPDIGRQMAGDEVSADSLLAAEEKTRSREIADILHTLEPHLRPHDPTPMIVAGDFNSASHLDWTAGTAARHRGLVVPWPVSRQMERYGFTDAYRAVHPDPVTRPGRTWSPRFADEYPLRIDYVYHRGSGLRPIKAEMRDTWAEGWPSDHAAVLIEYDLTGSGD